MKPKTTGRKIPFKLPEYYCVPAAGGTVFFVDLEYVALDRLEPISPQSAISAAL